MPVILHNNPSQSQACLVGMVKYANRIVAKGGEQYAQLGSFPAVVKHIRSCPFERDHGNTTRGVTTCVPIQRARIWPDTFNCFEATAHSLGAFLYWELARRLDFHVFDRNLGPGTRHVWPVVVDPATVQGFIIVLDSVVPRQHNGMLANAWYNDTLGVAHKAGRVVLKLYGLDSVGEAGEQVWGTNLPNWARESPKQAPRTYARRNRRKARL